MPTAASPPPASATIWFSSCPLRPRWRRPCRSPHAARTARPAWPGRWHWRGRSARRVDQEHAGTDAVEGIGECRRFRGLALHRRADQHRAAHMRSDEPHAPAHLIVGNALPLITKHAEERDARRRFLERDPQMVHQALRPRPLPIVARLQELVVGNEIGGGERLLDPWRRFQRSCWGRASHIRRDRAACSADRCPRHRSRCSRSSWPVSLE